MDGKNYKIGEKIGSLLIKARKGMSKNSKNIIWEVQCDCGSVSLKTTSYFSQSKVPTCKECLAKQLRTIGNDIIGGCFFYRMRYVANERNIQFNVSIQEISDLLVLQDFKCALSGLPLKTYPYKKALFTKATASLDRKDSKLNYDIDNIQWVDKRINKMKSVFEQQEFIQYCDLVAKRFDYIKDYWVESNGDFI